MLKNLDGIRDELIWQRREARRVNQRVLSIPAIDAHLPLADQMKIVHRHLFQDCHEWAGEFRDVDMHKPNFLHPEGESVFCPYDEINDVLAHAQKIHNELLSASSNLSTEQQVTLLARVHATLNYAHPFREGNGRTTREVISINAAEMGMLVDWSAVKGETMDFVSTLSMSHSDRIAYEPFLDMYAAVVSSPANYTVVKPPPPAQDVDIDAIVGVFDDSLISEAPKQMSGRPNKVYGEEKDDSPHKEAQIKSSQQDTYDL